MDSTTFDTKSITTDQVCTQVERAISEAEAAAPKLITMDQARIQVGRAIAKNLRANIAEVEATDPTSEIDSANKLLVVAAAKELHDSVLMLVKKLERPLILRPNRSVKIARRS
jgi:hypothetical protein